MDDLRVAQLYIGKAESSRARRIPFTLNFTSFRNLMNAEKCAYTGLPLSPETRTVDRIDNKKGYIKGNVVACHTQMNSLKSIWENPQTELTEDLVYKALKSLRRR